MKKKKIAVACLAIFELLFTASLIIVFTTGISMGTLTISVIILICMAAIGYNLYKNIIKLMFRFPPSMYERAFAPLLRGVFEKSPSKRKKLVRAIAYGKSGHTSHAVGMLTSLLASCQEGDERTRSVVNFFIGVTYDEAGSVKEAISAYEAATRYENASAKVYSNLGVDYMKTRDYKEAEEKLKIAISRDASSNIAHSNLANLYIRMHLPDKAREEAEAAIAIKEDSLEGHMVLAVAAAFGSSRSEVKRRIQECEKYGANVDKLKEITDRIMRGDLSVLEEN